MLFEINKLNLIGIPVNIDLLLFGNEILKRESSKCILDLPRVERRRTRIVTLG
jgi:hypothetical protein